MNYTKFFSEEIIHKYKDLPTFLKEQSSTDCSFAIRKDIEKTVEYTLIKCACIQFKYMELTNNFSEESRYEVFRRFFLQPIFNQHFKEIPTDLDQKLNYIYSELNIKDLTIKQCIQEIKNFKFKFKSVTINMNKISLINKVLKFCHSKYFIISSIDGIWYSANLVETEKFKNKFHIQLVNKEHLIFPIIAPTLAAQTISKHIYLRNSCFEFMYNMKWKYFFNQQDNVYSFNESYTISSIFQKCAVKQLDNQDEKKYKEQIIDQIITNVYNHETGHFLSHDIVDVEAMAIMKKIKVYPYLFSEQVDECYADFMPQIAENSGTLVAIANIAKKDYKKAERLFFTYASDTWFFDTSDTSMFEYTEMLHLFLLAYMDKVNKKILFEQMIADLNFNSPTSFLTKLVALNNTSILEIKNFLKNQSYSIDGKAVTFSFLDNIVREDIENKNNKLDCFSYSYYSFYWAGIFVLVSKYLDNKSAFDLLLEDIKQKIYVLFFNLSTKKNLNSKQAKKYIIYKYKKILPSFYENISLNQ